LQVPSSHTSFVPHEAPLGRLLCVFAQTEAPLVQLVAQRVHDPAGVHTLPDVHGLQRPERQTWFAPHEVPLVTGVPVSLHDATPEEQSIAPTSQALPAGTHDAPDAHALHEPLSHTAFVPHDCPLVRFVPVSSHASAPLEQSVSPVWQAFVGVHETPAVQPVHAPLSHTRSVPHDAPFASDVPVSLQTGRPEAQSMVPWSHALVGVHAAPDTHAPQLPLSQTRPLPHEAPFNNSVPVSLQTSVPLEHDVTPA